MNNIMKIKTRWNNLLSNLLPDRPIDDTTNGKNIIAIARGKIMSEFQESLEEYKEAFEYILFCNTAFTVYVCPKDYKRVKDAFAVMIVDIIKQFEEILNSELSNRTNVQFCSIDNVWSFNIRKVEGNQIRYTDGDNPDSEVTPENVERNRVIVCSTVCRNQLYNFPDTSEDNDVIPKTRQPKSKQHRIQEIITIDARDLQLGKNGEYTYPIKLKGLKSTQTSGSKVLATLKIVHDTIRFIDIRGVEYEIYTINDRNTDFYIGGSSAAISSQGKEMIRLSSETIMCPHLEIKLDETDPEGSFKIRAIGKVRLNRIPLPKDEWRTLSNNNLPILLDDSVELIFSKKR